MAKRWIKTYKIVKNNWVQRGGEEGGGERKWQDFCNSLAFFCGFNLHLIDGEV